MESARDRGYWADYYKRGVAPEEPSQFAHHVMDNYAKQQESLIELGCGNGRDARFFAHNKLAVIAVDQCEPEIEALSSVNPEHKLDYVTADFTNLEDATLSHDLVYSRFTLHSIDAAAQARTLAWSYRNLADGGRLCIETRGQKNELYRKGEPVKGEADAFIHDGHYRRFVDFDEFTAEVEANKFNIVEASEKTGYAPFGDTDYHFIRIIAER